jgi:hypothetical protein
MRIRLRVAGPPGTVVGGSPPAGPPGTPVAVGLPVVSKAGLVQA